MMKFTTTFTFIYNYNDEVQIKYYSTTNNEGTLPKD